MNSNSEIERNIFRELSLLPGLKETLAVIDSKVELPRSILSDVSKHLLSIGGKRLRPALALLAAYAVNSDLSEKQRVELYDFAAGVELIHMASLLHDDIIDNAEVRRHLPSALKKFGLTPTIISGDYLLVRAFALCARLPVAIVNLTEQACIDLCNGEVRELPLNLNQKKQNRDDVIETARLKTGALFRLSCEGGAIIAGSTDQSGLRSFANFGELLGITFQLRDDLLDITATKDSLGKDAGSDIRERKAALPSVLWAEHDTALVKRVFGGDAAPLSQIDVAAALQEMATHGIPQKTEAIIKHYGNMALQALDSWQHGQESEPNQYGQLLREIVLYLL